MTIKRLRGSGCNAAGRRPRRLSIYLTELTVHGGSELTGGRLTAMWSAVLVGGGRAAGQMPKLVLGRDGHGVLDDGLHSEGRDGWVLERGAQGPWREFCILLESYLNTDYLSIQGSRATAIHGDYLSMLKQAYRWGVYSYEAR